MARPGSVGDSGAGHQGYPISDLAALPITHAPERSGDDWFDEIRSIEPYRALDDTDSCRPEGDESDARGMALSLVDMITPGLSDSTLTIRHYKPVDRADPSVLISGETF